MTAATKEPPPSRLAAMRRADLADYSIVRALRTAVFDDREPDGLEGEVSREVRRQFGRDPGALARTAGPSFYLPLVAPVRLPRPEARDLTTTTGSGGLHAPTDFARVVDFLRAKSLVLSAGAMLLDTMAGSAYHLPRITTGASAYWISEGNSAVESAEAIEQLTFVPRTVSCFTDISRILVSTSGPNAERIVTADIIRALGVALDAAALAGPGSAGTPEGILYNTDTPPVPAISLGANGGAMTRAAAIAAELAIAQSSADNGPMQWIGSPKSRAKMRATEVSAGSGLWLWSDSDRILSAPADATFSMPDNLAKGTGTNLGSLILGRWNSLVIGTWGAISILVDRFSLGTSGGVRIVAFLDCDARPRNPQAFVKFTDVLTT